MRVRLPFVLVLLVVGWTVPGTTLGVQGSRTALTHALCEVRDVAFEVNGAPAPLVSARRGDHVEVAFSVPYGCVNEMTFASFVAPDPAFDGSRLGEQALFDRDGGRFGPGRHSMTVDVFAFPGDAAVDCSIAPRVWGAAGPALRAAVQAKMASDPDYRAEVVREVQARRSTDPRAFRSQPVDRPCSGAGGGDANRMPCDGCVGNADDRNPPGQDPHGEDGNSGYECDLNAGIGDGNPAHTGCRNFQVDLAYAGDPPAPGADPASTRRLIAGVFCVGTTDLCYVTDRTGSLAAFRAG